MLEKYSMLIKIADRHEAGAAISTSDAQLVRSCFFDDDIDDDNLTIVANIIFDLFRCSRDIQGRLESIINMRPVPSLTAACLRGLAEFCYLTPSEAIDKLRKYVDFDRYYHWPEEVIFSANFFKRHLAALTGADSERLKNFRRDAESAGASELTELLDR